MNNVSKVGLVGLSILFALAACSKGSQSSNATTNAAATAAASAAGEAASAAGAAATAAAGAAGAAAGAAKGAAGAAAGAAGAAAGAAGSMVAGNASDGAKVYTTNCSSCHQATGAGVPGTFPPLANNPVVTGDPTKLIHIIKYGLTGKIAVNGTDYNGQMPNWNTQLSDADIANVATYVRSSWGNKAGPITTAQVKAVAK